MDSAHRSASWQEGGGEPCLITEHVLDLAQLFGNVERAAFYALIVHLVKHLRVVVYEVHLTTNICTAFYFLGLFSPEAGI